MNQRRVIGSILTLALLAGSVFVPLARAACALPSAKTAPCPSCSGALPTGAASVSTDRSCCAPPASLSDRDPATTGSVRSGDPGSGDPISTLAGDAVPVSLVAAADRTWPARHPGSSPPLLRTTVLRI